MAEKDWKKYNRNLVKRGEIWVSRDVLQKIKEKDEEENKRGRPYKYKSIFIKFILILRYMFNLPYRQTEGFIRGIFKWFNIDIPNFRTICYRNKKMEIEYEMSGEIRDNAVIVIDSTGMKVTNRGDWKGWIKVHVAYDIESKQIVDFEVTDERGQDCKEGLKIIERLVERYNRANKRIKKVIGDAGYDTHEIFNYLSERGICEVK